MHACRLFMSVLLSIPLHASEFKPKFAMNYLPGTSLESTESACKLEEINAFQQYIKITKKDRNARRIVKDRNANKKIEMLNHNFLMIILTTTA